MKKLACKLCKILVTGDTCPLCKGAQFVPNWKGRIIVLNHKESRVADKMGLEADGEFAIKVV
ncbi:DNA-directed RNA polymerase subunit E'' [Candidatus Woesearchaeota archaeon]|nr:DNA-directed RNA polymerase subunit E'' [Candidatus Woesearchaeota archaeon]